LSNTVASAPRFEMAEPTVTSAPSSERITEQLSRLIPLVNGRRGVATVEGSAKLSGLPSLLSWDTDGQLLID
jgi:hypothetical protein